MKGLVSCASLKKIKDIEMANHPKYKTDISVIVPVYNEEENIRKLYDELKEIFSYTDRSYELIFINDASADDTLEVLSDLAKEDNTVKIINFWRNFGQTAALTAGIDLSSGQIIIPMDGDGQNDPADIPLLVEKIEEGYAVVSGWRKNRKDAFARVLPSMIANWLIRRITGIKIHDNGCSLKAFKREILEGVQLYGEMHRFISVYASWSGGKVAEVVVNHRPRIAGKSKYGMSRIFKVILDLYVIKFLYSYINRPIHFFGKYGFRFLALGLGIEIWAIILKLFFHRSFIATPLPQIGILFILVAMQLMLTGVVAELLMRTYYESQNKKPYKIKDSVNI